MEKIEEFEEELNIPCSTTVEVSLRLLVEKLISKIKELNTELTKQIDTVNILMDNNKRLTEKVKDMVENGIYFRLRP